MKTFKQVPTEIVSEIICDCCKRCFTADDADWSEIQSIEFLAGYASIFGDGNSVSIDLCQNCLKQNLGPWLRLDSEPRQAIDDKVLFDEPENLTPPRGYQSWLHYAIDTMETRSLELEGIFTEWPDHAGKAVTREEMRVAAQRELFQVLKGSVFKYEGPTEPIGNLKGVLPTPEATAAIDNMRAVDDTENQGWQEWNIGPPVGCEFGADSLRFTRALQQAISVFGDQLAAVQWLISFNAAVDGEPMKLVIESEEGCNHVMAILSAIETGGVA